MSGDHIHDFYKTEIKQVNYTVCWVQNFWEHYAANENYRYSVKLEKFGNYVEITKSTSYNHESNSVSTENNGH